MEGKGKGREKRVGEGMRDGCWGWTPLLPHIFNFFFKSDDCTESVNFVLSSIFQLTRPTDTNCRNVLVINVVFHNMAVMTVVSCIGRHNYFVSRKSAKYRPIVISVSVCLTVCLSLPIRLYRAFLTACLFCFTQANKDVLFCSVYVSEITCLNVITLSIHSVPVAVTRFSSDDSTIHRYFRFCG